MIHNEELTHSGNTHCMYQAELAAQIRALTGAAPLGTAAPVPAPPAVTWLLLGELTLLRGDREPIACLYQA